MKTKQKIKITKYTASLAIIWGACLLLIGVGYMFFQLPQQTTLAQIERQYDESRQAYELAETAGSESIRQKAQQQMEEVQQTIDALSLPEGNVTGLVFQIGKIADELELADFSSKHIKNQSVSTVEKSKHVNEAWLEVEFKGSFEQFAQFVNRLEQSTPAVYVEDLRIVRDNHEHKYHEVKIELSFLATTNPKKRSVAMK
ncbi:MAG: hypothetical protein ACYTER_05690 [Planctomycetota bacterium]|jgi:Tfp pilus assembly protein PilO